MCITYILLAQKAWLTQILNVGTGPFKYKPKTGAKKKNKKIKNKKWLWMAQMMT